MFALPRWHDPSSASHASQASSSPPHRRRRRPPHQIQIQPDNHTSQAQNTDTHQSSGIHEVLMGNELDERVRSRQTVVRSYLPVSVFIDSAAQKRKRVSFLFARCSKDFFHPSVESLAGAVHLQRLLFFTTRYCTLSLFPTGLGLGLLWGLRHLAGDDVALEPVETLDVSSIDSVGHLLMPQ